MIGKDYPRYGECENCGDASISMSALRKLESDLAALRRENAELRTEMDSVWNYLQKVSPWSVSNDMLWSDEIICGIDMLIEHNVEVARDAARYRWLRTTADHECEEDSLEELAWFALHNESPEEVDSAIDAALGAVVREEKAHE